MTFRFKINACTCHKYMFLERRSPVSAHATVTNNSKGTSRLQHVFHCAWIVSQSHSCDKLHLMCSAFCHTATQLASRQGYQNYCQPLNGISLVAPTACCCILHIHLTPCKSIFAMKLHSSFTDSFSSLLRFRSSAFLFFSCFSSSVAGGFHFLHTVCQQV